MAAAAGRGVTWGGCVRDEASCNGGRAALSPPAAPFLRPALGRSSLPAPFSVYSFDGGGGESG